VTVDLGPLSATPISAERWPDVARVPSGALSIGAAPIADRLFRNAAARLPLRMVYPDGTVVGAADPTLPTMVIHRPDRLARRIGRYGLIGFGESYMAGEWSSDDLAGVLTEFANSMADLIPRSLQRLRPVAVVRQPRSQFNNREQARRNISEHYDLSNELFAEFLDETLTYSSALFDTLPSAPVVFELDLAAVQARVVPQAQPLPRQQAARRDLALVVQEQVKHDALMAALRDDATGLVRSATLFDVYRPKADAADFAPGERSLAVRLELLSDDATLTDEIIDAAVASAIARAAAACGARLRA